MYLCGIWIFSDARFVMEYSVYGSMVCDGQNPIQRHDYLTTISTSPKLLGLFLKESLFQSGFFIKKRLDVLRSLLIIASV